MTVFDMLEWAFYVVMLSALGCLGIPQLRYFWHRSSRGRWPSASATIQKRFVGKVGGYGGRAAFFGYEFTVEGTSYSGKFAVFDREAHAQESEDNLDGLPIVVRYDASNPNVSLLSDFADDRFMGKVATQNPYWFINVSDVRPIQILKLGKK